MLLPMSNAPERIAIPDLEKKLAGKTKPVVVDVRKPAEIAESGAIPGAIHIPVEKVPDRLAEQAVAVFLVPLRIRRRKCPVLPLRRKIVRRSAYPAPGNIEIAVCPQIAAPAVGRQREVVIESDRQSLAARVLLRFGELHVDLDVAAGRVGGVPAAAGFSPRS